MKRREFIKLVGGAAAWPLSARAQQLGKLPTIGFLGTSTLAAWSQWTAAFGQRLHQLGWIEGRTVTIAYRWAEGRSERSSPSSRPSSPGSRSMSLSQLDWVPPRQSKRHRSSRSFSPWRTTRLPAVWLRVWRDRAATSPACRCRETLDLEPVMLEIRRAEDIAPALEGLKSRAEALYVCGDPLAIAHRVRINSLALGARLPTKYNYREFVEAGGLLSHGANVPDLFRRAADFADKILRGAKPSNIPIEQPTRFDLIVNVTTAKVLGIDVPPMLLARADEIIE
jgi:putative ABC transport system substrate-binding protein